MISRSLADYFPILGNAKDPVGGHDGAVYGASLTTDYLNRPNRAYYFDGLSNYIDTGNYYPVANNQVTLCAWIRVDSLKAQDGYNYVGYIIAKGNDATANSFGLCVSNPGGDSGTSNIRAAVMSFTNQLNYAQSFNGSIKAGKWHFLVGVINETSLKLYIDGVLLAEATANTTFSDSGASIILGKQIRTNYEYRFNGAIADIRMYKSVLSDNDILSLYINKKGYYSLFDKCVSYFNFSRGTLDLIGRNNGSVSGPSLSTNHFGIYNGAYSFSRSNNYIDLGSDSSLSVSYPITLVSMVKLRSYSPDGNVGQVMASQYGTGGGFIFSLTGPSAAFPELRVHSPTSIPEGIHYSRSPDSLWLNKWYIIVGTFDGTYNKIYVDGVLKKSTNMIGCQGRAQVWLGRATWDNYNTNLQFDGEMSCFGMWNRAMDGNEVAHLSALIKSKPLSIMMR